MTVLLDANVLIALIVDGHVHHESAEVWFADLNDSFATCPVTEGSLLRFLIRQGWPSQAANGTLRSLCADPRHVFWPDDASFTEVAVIGIVGHRQLTDGYLAHLSRTHGGSWPALMLVWLSCTATLWLGLTMTAPLR